jgi:N-acetylmuramoyl-L-alanine amidase
MASIHPFRVWRPNPSATAPKRQSSSPLAPSVQPCARPATGQSHTRLPASRAAHLKSLTLLWAKPSTCGPHTTFLAGTARTSIRWIITLSAVFFLAALPLVAQAPPAASVPRYVVVLDAAHGGSDSGATLGDGQPEKAVTLALSVRLRSLLAARGLTVLTTRESDIDLDADQRATLANRANAQLCLVLHATQSGSGVHLFTSSLAPVQLKRFLPWNTAQAAFVTRSLSLAGMLNSTVLHAGFNVTLARVSLPGLDSLACPAVAVELAPKRGSDNSILAEPDNSDYQAQVASALVDAIFAWRAEAPQP